MDSFILGIVVGVVINIITALFNRRKGLQLLPWFLFYIFLHGTYVLFVNTEWGQQVVMIYQRWPSFLLAACVTLLVWAFIIYSVDRLDHATRDDSPDDKTTAQLRLEEIQQRQIQPYTIRKADQEEFIRILRLAGPFHVDIEYDVNSDLAGLFAEELKTLLALSQWKVEDPSVVAVDGPRPLRGVIITVNEKEEIPIGASLLHDLLRKQDIDVQLEPAPPRKILQASFYIFIGPKP